MRSDDGVNVTFCHKDCENPDCNRYPQIHGNCNGPTPFDRLRFPDWNMDDVFRPEIQPVLEMLDYRDW